MGDYKDEAGDGAVRNCIDGQPPLIELPGQSLKSKVLFGTFHKVFEKPDVTLEQSDAMKKKDIDDYKEYGKDVLEKLTRKRADIRRLQDWLRKESELDSEEMVV